MESEKYNRVIFTVHPFDPRGNKVGGIETHVRQTLKYRPDNIQIVMVGIDDTATLPLGKITTVKNANGSSYDFFPIMRGNTRSANQVAKKITESLTFKFFIALFKYQKEIKELTKNTAYSFESQRYEFAWFFIFNKLNYIQLTHGDADPNKPMDTLLSKLWFIHEFNEKVAIKYASKIISVSSEQTKRLKANFPNKEDSICCLTVSVDDKLFQPEKFNLQDDVLKVAFVGRLDSFKRPGMMFRVINSISQKLDGKVEFNYIGTSDPFRYKEYRQIKDKVKIHGYKTSDEVSELWKEFHMGIVTSAFEGWPVYVMEAICSGRPVVSVRLEQMRSVFCDQIAGYMFDSNNDSDQLVNNMSGKFVEYWEKIKFKKIDETSVNKKINNFKASKQIKKIFDYHSDVSNM